MKVISLFKEHGISLQQNTRSKLCYTVLFASKYTEKASLQTCFMYHLLNVKHNNFMMHKIHKKDTEQIYYLLMLSVILWAY